MSALAIYEARGLKGDNVEGAWEDEGTIRIQVAAPREALSCGQCGCRREPIHERARREWKSAPLRTKLVETHGLLNGKAVGVDLTLLEANAAMNYHGQSKRHGGVAANGVLWRKKASHSTGRAGSCGRRRVRTGEPNCNVWPLPKGWT